MGSDGARQGQIDIRESPSFFLMAVWAILLVIFATFLALGIIGLIMTLMSRAGFGKVGEALGVLMTFNGPKIAGFINSSLASGSALLLLGFPLAGVAILLLKGIEKTGRRRAVTPLIPGAKRKFVPCEEGLYTQKFRNLYTRSRWYKLRPWDSLCVNSLDDRKCRISLRDGKSLMYLRMAARGEKAKEYYETVKDVILSRLSPENRTPNNPRRLRAAWGLLAVILVSMVVAASVGANYLESHTTGKPEDNICDICGRRLGYFYVKQVQNGETVQEYCELHGFLQATVHPVVSLRSLEPAAWNPSSGIQGVARNGTVLSALTLWWIVGCLVVVIVVPKPLMLDR